MFKSRRSWVVGLIIITMLVVALIVFSGDDESLGGTAADGGPATGGNEWTEHAPASGGNDWVDVGVSGLRDVPLEPRYLTIISLVTDIVEYPQLWGLW